MYMQTTKKTVIRRPVKYSALSSGTVSSVWYDEDQAAQAGQKRRNRITIMREKSAKPSKKAATQYDA